MECCARIAASGASHASCRLPAGCTAAVDKHNTGRWTRNCRRTRAELAIGCCTAESRAGQQGKEACVRCSGGERAGVASWRDGGTWRLWIRSLGRVRDRGRHGPCRSTVCGRPRLMQLVHCGTSCATYFQLGCRVASRHSSCRFGRQIDVVNIEISRRWDACANV